jgi:hypothetical protein
MRGLVLSSRSARTLNCLSCAFALASGRYAKAVRELGAHGMRAFARVEPSCAGASAMSTGRDRSARLGPTPSGRLAESSAGSPDGSIFR